MAKPDNHKAPYVDISYGWQEREEGTRLRGRRRLRWWFALAATVVLAALIYLIWRLG